MGKYDFKLNTILKELEKKENKEGRENFTSDFWKPTIEKGQESISYRIRFLPNPDSENGCCWVERFAHMFSFPNKKYTYQACPKRNIGKKCYFCEQKDLLYATGDPDKEALGQKRTPKLRYFYNVLVLEDGRESDKNVGKVFIYEAGIQIHEKLTKFLCNKEVPEEERIFFHPTRGCDFNLVLKMKKTTGGEFQNYDDSEFSRRASAIRVDGKTLDMDTAEVFIEKHCHKLNERILTDKAYKSYDELKEIYINQGDVSEKSERKDKKEEEVATTVDETIRNEKVQTRNPEKKVAVEKDDEDDDIPFDADDSNDDDAELESLLKD